MAFGWLCSGIWLALDFVVFQQIRIRPCAVCVSYNFYEIMTTNTTNLLVADRILSTPFVVCAQVLHDGPITLRKRARRDHTQQTNGSCASLSLFKCILICIEIFPCRCMHTYKFSIYILYIHTFIWVWAFNPRRIGVLLMVSTIGVKV